MRCTSQRVNQNSKALGLVNLAGLILGLRQANERRRYKVVWQDELITYIQGIHEGQGNKQQNARIRC